MDGRDRPAKQHRDRALIMNINGIKVSRIAWLAAEIVIAFALLGVGVVILDYVYRTLI